VIRTMRCLLAVVAVVLVMGLGGRAQAGILVENFSAELGPATTVGGVPLGGNGTPFSFQAAFDTTTGTPVAQGIELFSVTSFTIEISGVSTFTGIANSNLNVFLFDPSSSLVAYGVGLATASTQFGFFGVFGTASTPFSAAAPTPSMLSDFEGGEAK
jgi:hypothetical protein